MVPNRYLFITAEFDPAIIPLPELRPIPEIPEEGDEEELARLTREKEMAERANQREQERYNAAIESGKRRAAELSDRFADWYYVISDDVYQNIHLTEANVFRVATQGSEPTWGRDMLEGIDLESILGTPPPAGHLPVLPGMDALGLESIETNELLPEAEAEVENEDAEQSEEPEA